MRHDTISHSRIRPAAFNVPQTLHRKQLNNFVCELFARLGMRRGPCALAVRVSQTFVYRGLTGRVIILSAWPSSHWPCSNPLLSVSGIAFGKGQTHHVPVFVCVFCPRWCWKTRIQLSTSECELLKKLNGDVHACSSLRCCRASVAYCLCAASS